MDGFAGIRIRMSAFVSDDGAAPGGRYSYQASGAMRTLVS